jgi:hypothetical protein
MFTDPGGMSLKRSCAMRLTVVARACAGYGILFLLVVLAQRIPVANAQSIDSSLPAPKGLNPCANNDSVASVEARLAPSLGAKYLGCFSSNEKSIPHGGSGDFPVPVEYAIALSISGGPYGPTDLSSLLSKAREQWKSFDPLSKEHREYTERLNALIKDTAPKVGATAVTSIKPVLISIEPVGTRAYVVLSIRQYEVAAHTGTVRLTKASATAMVLQGSRLVRLELFRELRDPSDVDAVRMQIVAWVHAVGADTGKPSPPR